MSDMRDRRDVRPEDLDELLGAYALDALDPDERREVEEYLAISPRARAEVREHQEVATYLAFSGASAPDGLWDRIAVALEDVPPEPGPVLAPVMPMVSPRTMGAPRAGRGRLGAAGRVGTWVIGAAAAAAVAVVAVSAVDRAEAPTDPMAQAVEAAREDRDSRIVTLQGDGLAAEAIVDRDGHGYLLGQSLPSLPSDRTYQLWGVVDDEVISLGVLGRDPAVEAFSVDGDLSALVITDEVAGGVAVSEQPAALVAEL